MVNVVISSSLDSFNPFPFHISTGRRRSICSYLRWHSLSHSALTICDIERAPRLLVVVRVSFYRFSVMLYPYSRSRAFVHFRLNTTLIGGHETPLSPRKKRSEQESSQRANVVWSERHCPSSVFLSVDLTIKQRLSTGHLGAAVLTIVILYHVTAGDVFISVLSTSLPWPSSMASGLMRWRKLMDDDNVCNESGINVKCNVNLTLSAVSVIPSMLYITLWGPSIATSADAHHLGYGCCCYNCVLYFTTNLTKTRNSIHDAYMHGLC